MEVAKVSTRIGDRGSEGLPGDSDDDDTKRNSSSAVKVPNARATRSTAFPSDRSSRKATTRKPANRSTSKASQDGESASASADNEQGGATADAAYPNASVSESPRKIQHQVSESSRSTTVSNTDRPSRRTRTSSSSQTELHQPHDLAALVTPESPGKQVKSLDRSLSSSPSSSPNPRRSTRRQCNSEASKIVTSYAEVDEGDYDFGSDEGGIEGAAAHHSSRRKAAKSSSRLTRKRSAANANAYEEDALASDRTAKKARIRNKDQSRIHLRLIPVEDEPKVMEAILKECKHLLVCEEPLKPDKTRKIYVQEAQCNRDFEDRFLEFLLFQRVYGHALVPKYHEENKPLGRWCARVRNWKSKGKHNLTKSRERRLNEAGFCWDAKKNPDFWKLQNTCEQAQDRWDQMFENLLEYKKEFGNCLVPKVTKGKKYQKLARWVIKIRREFRNKQRDQYHTLSDERERRLLDVGFVFNTKKGDSVRAIFMARYQANWDAYFKRLEKFKAKHGHCRVPRRYKHDQSLASWVMRQRCQSRKMQAGIDSYMTVERLRRLEDVDFCFSVGIGKGGVAVAGKREDVDGDDDDDDEGDEEDGTEEDDQEEEEEDEGETVGQESNADHITAAEEDAGGSLENSTNEKHHETSNSKEKGSESSRPAKRARRSTQSAPTNRKEKDSESSRPAKRARRSTRRDTDSTDGKISATMSASLSGETGEREEVAEESESESAKPKADPGEPEPASEPEEPEPEHDLVNSEYGKEVIRDGRWSCLMCGRKNFKSCIEALAHEYKCRDLKPKANARK